MVYIYIYILLKVSGKPSPYSLNPEKTTKGSCLGAPILKLPTLNPEPQTLGFNGGCETNLRFIASTWGAFEISQM